MARLNTLVAVVVAASYGRDRLRADGYQVDYAAFETALASLAKLAELDDLSRGDTARKMPEDERMTPRDVAAQKGCTPTAVRLAARQGRLTGHQVDGRWTFTPTDVEHWSPR